MPFIEVNTDTICKHENEAFYIGFDFSDDLGPSETINQTKTQIKTYRVSDLKEVSGIVDTNEVYYDGAIVIFKIQGGELNKQYLIEVTIETNKGNVFASRRRLKIV